MYWTVDFFDETIYNYQPFSFSQTSVSIICGILFQMTLKSDFENSTRMITYLKRSSTMKNHSKGRLINILLAFMQSMSSIVTICALIFTFTKENSLAMIIKSFVTVAFIVSIDDAFAGTLPPSIKANADDINENNPLKFSRDNNTFSHIFSRVKSLKLERQSLCKILLELVNCSINMYFMFLMAFEKLLFNYLVPYIVLIFQMIGYHSYASTF